MVGGNRDPADARLHDALDVCLGQMRRGESLEQCLSSYPDVADELRPLLEMAGSLLASRVEAPDAPRRLESARQRLLAVASMLSDGEQEASDDAYGALAATLDECLEQVRAGESVGAVVAEHPYVEPDLASLLALASRLPDAVAAPPPPPQGLQDARSRFLSAAESAKHAASELDDAVDLAVSRTLAGQSVEHTEEAIAPLAELAARLSADRMVIPPPPTGLANARQRFISAADAARAAAARSEAAGSATPRTAAASSGRSRSVFGRLSEWLQPALPSAAPRFALVTAAVLIALIVGASPLSHTVEASIPGDALYPVKRIGEDFRLLVTRDESERQALLAEYSARRDEEIRAATSAGVVADVSWQVYFESLTDGPGSARIVVLLLDGGGNTVQRRELVLGPQTRFLLGAFDRIDDVPAGSLLSLMVRTQPGDPSGLPLAILVELVSTPSDGVGRLVVRGPPAADGAVDRAGRTVKRLRSATPPPARLAATPTIAQEPATVAAAASATPSPVPVTVAPTRASSEMGEATKDPREGTLRGILDERIDDLNWAVADADQGGAVVRVEVSNLKGSDRAIVRPRDGIDLSGLWLSPDHHRFAADRLDEYWPREEICHPDSATGTVIEYKPGSYLSLSDSREFSMSGVGTGAIEGAAPLEVGAQVTVYFDECRFIRRVTRIVVLRGAGAPARETGTIPPPGVPYQGTVEQVIEPGRSFTLLADDGNLYTVLYGPDTPITGEATQIRWQQEVGVIGWLEGTELTAQSIKVYADAPPTATPLPSTSPAPTTGAMGPPVTPPSVPTVMPPGSETG